MICFKLRNCPSISSITHAQIGGTWTDTYEIPSRFWSNPYDKQIISDNISPPKSPSTQNIQNPIF